MGKVKKKAVFRKINLDLIDRPDDIVRLEIGEGELRELADSIEERGLLQPIGVAPRGNRFLIVFGDRRYLAHQMLKKEDIMCRIEEIDDVQIVLDRGVENILRVNLTPFEEGHLYVGLVEKAGLSIAEISERVKKSAGVVQRKMDVLKMPESFQKALHAGSISLSVAEELWSCPDAAKREYFLEMAVEHGITQAVARLWVSEFRKEHRSRLAGTGEGGGNALPLDDVPIYRGCDVCRNPVSYDKIKDLRICPDCFDGIMSVLKKQA